GSLEVERRSILEQAQRLEDDLRDVAEGPAPLLIVRSLLHSIAEQDRLEERAQQSESLDGVLNERDAQIVAAGRASGATERALKAIAVFMSSDRKQRTQSSARERYLHLDSESR